MMNILRPRRMARQAGILAGRARVPARGAPVPLRYNTAIDSGFNDLFAHFGPSGVTYRSAQAPA
ncbi:hypothetical protein LGM65_21065 [Burkholderia anthina]|uniref:hypothetical protein n=1 Tax=Burkholderia anthina TaxID=179879 RepID=UPI001CF321BE|nr:hypothetical protein [Burkholderia anthina]MCA8093346.1 hypothetical protein [Burkholderia anthina]